MLSHEEMEVTINRALDDITDTTNRTQSQAGNTSSSNNRWAEHNLDITDDDIKALKLKFHFLQDYSNSFIRQARPENLVKLESTNMKMKEAERSRDADDRLAYNRFSVSSRPKPIPAGQDDRHSTLHVGRFLPGACCPNAKLWKAARSYQGLSGAEPLGNYDMGSLGVGGQTTAKGWVDIHNPSSTKLTIRSFNINNCGVKASGSSRRDCDEDQEFLEIAEFTTALRTMRTAMQLVHPWNLSLVALENFLLNNKMCHDDIGGLDKQAAILTRFTDYILSENATRWRDENSFMNAGELANTWIAFFSAMPQSQLVKRHSDKPKQHSGGGGNNQKQQNSSTNSSGGFRGNKLPYIDVCYKVP